MMSNAELIRSAAIAAAKWWADRLRDGCGVGNNGDRSVHGAMGMTMVGMIRDRHPPTHEQCDQFETRLGQRIVLQLTKPDEDGRWYYDRIGWDDGGVDLCLSVDYNPCQMLRAALLEAGVERNVADVAALPLKTTMRVSRRRVMVAHGYGRPWAEIHGPVYGSTRAEHDRVETEREKYRAAVYEAWISSGRQWDRRGPDDWQGPV